MKQLTVFFAVVVVALAIAAPASAHTGVIEITCQEVTYTYFAFPANSTTESHEIVVVDGVTVHDATFSFAGTSAEHSVPLTISGNAVVTASFDFTSSDGFTGEDTEEAALSCGGTTGGTTGTTTGGTTGTTTGGTTGGTTTGGPTTTTGGPTTTTGGPTTGTTGGTTGGGAGGAGGSGSTGEPSGELPFTGLPIWLPLGLAAAFLVGGALLLRRGRDNVS
jgi:hypothetical protein